MAAAGIPANYTMPMPCGGELWEQRWRGSGRLHGGKIGSTPAVPPVEERVAKGIGDILP